MPLLSNYPQLKVIQDIVREKNTAVHLVGGFLRDFCLGVEKKDFDFAVQNNALNVAEIFSNRIRGAYVLLDEQRGCARVIKKIKGSAYTFDFADFRQRTLRRDLGSRDFTINTLSLDISKLRESTEVPDILKDSLSGLKDIEEKCIKRVSVQSIQDDPLRMMRAFSLKALLGFKIESETLKQIRKEKALINNVSPERVREELFKILESPKAAPVLRAMDRVGLLEAIMPQIRIMRDCKQGTYHHLDVWPHSLETVSQMEKIFRQFRKDEEISAYIHETLGGNHSRKAIMKLAALLHDIGKPDTRKKEKGKVSFHSHEHVGKSIVTCIAKMLKLSRMERYALEDMVRWHLRPGYLSNFKNPSERAVYRYFRDAGEEDISILLLSLADQRSTCGPATTQRDQDHHEEICLKLVQRAFEKRNEKPFLRLINGDDLIRSLKIKPSPVFTSILNEIEEQQNLGKIKTKKEALVLAREIVCRKQ